MKVKINSSSSRLEFLDFLRFVAAFSVMLQHTLEGKSTVFVELCTDYFQFGVFGVTLFFLTSGFIIPVSIEKNKSLKAFWISRIFRLFPLYWTSIAVTIALIYFGLIEGTLPSGVAFLANISMFAKFLGQPLIQGLYWTLSLEMVFYLLVTTLFVIGLLRKSVLLAILALSASILLGVVATQVLHLYQNGWGLCFQLATMFVGTVFYRYMTKQTSFTAWGSVLVLAIVVLLATTYFNLFNNQIPEALGTRNFWPVTNAFFGAYVLFTICFLCRRVSYPKVFLYLGKISYSIYLVQATVLALLLPQVEGVFLSLFFGIGCTILVSSFTYTFIEKRFVQIGKQIVKKEKTAVASLT